MKTPVPTFCVIAILAASPANAQEPEDSVAATDQAEAADMETRITGGIADGKPGLPAPKPEPIPFEVMSSVTKRVHVVESPEMPGLPAPEGIISVTVQLVKDPGLSDPPPPLPALPPDDPAVLARMAESGAKYRETQLVYISATVYDRSRTLLRCYPVGGEKRKITAWSNLDFNHFCGFATYRVKRADGEIRKYGLVMGLDNQSARPRAAWLAEHHGEHQAPEIPDLPDLASGGPAFIIAEDNASDAEGAEIIAGMHELYRVEGPRMEAAHHARIKAREERKAYLLANPPKPKDVKIRFWKRDAPSPRGARNLGPGAKP